MNLLWNGGSRYIVGHSSKSTNVARYFHMPTANIQIGRSD